MQYIKAIKTYCVSCKKNTVKECFSIRRTKQKKLMLASNCVYLWEKMCFIQKQEISNNWNNQKWKYDGKQYSKIYWIGNTCLLKFRDGTLVFHQI